MRQPRRRQAPGLTSGAFNVTTCPSIEEVWALNRANPHKVPCTFDLQKFAPEGTPATYYTREPPTTEKGGKEPVPSNQKEARVRKCPASCGFFEDEQSQGSPFKHVGGTKLATHRNND